MDLDAQHYRNNAAVQFALAEDVISLHPFRGNETVVDIGCGDGRVTNCIAKHVPSGEVIGIDPSAAMIDLAKDTFPNLAFILADARDFSLQKPCDVITCFSAMHWIPNQPAAMAHMIRHLKPGGYLLLMTFAKTSPYFGLLQAVIESDAWHLYAKTSICSHWQTYEQYQDVCLDLHLKTLCFESVLDTAVYENAKAFIDYVKGWLPCLIDLPANLHTAFLNDLAQQAALQYGQPNTSGFSIPYEKIVLYAQKP